MSELTGKLTQDAQNADSAPVNGTVSVPQRLKILIACEFSAVVRTAFQDRGHDAWSCDLLASERLGQHICGDVLGILDAGWDMMIAHPPCTRLCNSGVRWLAERNLWSEMRESAEFFTRILNAPIAKICVENPIPHKHAGLPKYTQIIHPWQFGHPETKATCLWLRGLPMLMPTRVVSGRAALVHCMSPGPNRCRERSRTYPGVARAMAEQWG